MWNNDERAKREQSSSIHVSEGNEKHQLKLVRHLLDSWIGRLNIRRMEIQLVTEETIETWVRKVK